MPNIYTYVDYTGYLAEVMESDLNFAGNWLPTANYYRYDVVTYGFARYICTTANTNQAPPSDLQFNGFWSIITFTSTGTGSSGTNTGGSGASVQMVQDVYSLAYRAYSIALTGTDLPTPGAVDPWVMQWIGHTYNIARTGTNAADVAQASANAADMWGRTAYHLGVAGTNAANSADRWGRDAYSLAVSGTNAAAAAQSAADSAWSYAGQAWNIAVAGTNAADQAYSIALQALYAAWAGTDAGGGASGSVPSWVMDWLAQTYNLSVAGTNAANQADTTANHAFSIAVAGTQAADQAYSLALQALYTAWTGTDTPTPGPGGGSGTVPSWVMDWLAQTYNLSTAGTTAANSADSWGRDAFHLAVVGTNAAAAAQAAATSALNLVNTITTLTEFGYQGTITSFVGQVPGWKTDIELTIRNGIVTHVGNSRYSVELFDQYEIGPAGTIAGDLGHGSRWDGTGRVLSWQNQYPEPGPNQINFGMNGGAMAMFSCSGTWGVDMFDISIGGTGWSEPWIVINEGYRVMGTESFESFSTGVVYGTNFTPDIGYGWTGTAAFYS